MLIYIFICKTAALIVISMTHSSRVTVVTLPVIKQKSYLLRNVL